MGKVIEQEGTLYELAGKYEDCFSDEYNNGKMNGFGKFNIWVVLLVRLWD